MHERIHADDLELKRVPDAGRHERCGGGSGDTVDPRAKRRTRNDDPRRGSDRERPGIRPEPHRERRGGAGGDKKRAAPRFDPPDERECESDPRERDGPRRIRDVECREFADVDRHERKPQKRRNRSKPPARDSPGELGHPRGRSGIDERQHRSNGRRRLAERREHEFAECEEARRVAGVEVDVGLLAAHDAVEPEKMRAFVLELEPVRTKQKEVGKRDQEHAGGGSGVATCHLSESQRAELTSGKRSGCSIDSIARSISRPGQ